MHLTRLLDIDNKGLNRDAIKNIKNWNRRINYGRTEEL